MLRPQGARGVAGKLIPADGALNWTDPDTHRLRCLMTANSLECILGSSQTYRAAAEQNWRAKQTDSVR